MKQHAHSPAHIEIPADIAAKCDGPDQFQRFDQMVSALVTVPKSAIAKQEKKYQRARAKKKAKKPD